MTTGVKTYLEGRTGEESAAETKLVQALGLIAEASAVVDGLAARAEAAHLAEPQAAERDAFREVVQTYDQLSRKVRDGQKHFREVLQDVRDLAFADARVAKAVAAIEAKREAET